MHFYREKQGLVPDFLIKLESDSTSAGGFRDALAELKFISAGLTYYNRTEKQVDIRSKSLQNEFTRKCQNIDQKYCGTNKGEVGPLEQHLHQFGDLIGLVVGQYGEGSQGLHNLVSYMAESIAKFICHARGNSLSAQETSFLLASYRRRLSVVAIRVQVRCLLARVGHLGPAAEQTAQRRAKVRGDEDLQRREMQANFEAYVWGKKLHTWGNLHP